MSTSDDDDDRRRHLVCHRAGATRLARSPVDANSDRTPRAGAV